MGFTVETEREEDGRWTAEVFEIPGVLKYGQRCEKRSHKQKRRPCA